MDINQLRYFTEVASTNNLTRAAENLHVAQSAVSRQIKLLEEELDQKLFKRGKYSMVPTGAGIQLLARAKEILGLIDKTKFEISKKEIISGSLSIAFIDRVFTKATAELLSGFQATYPGIKLRLYCGSLQYVSDLIAVHKSEIAFTFISDLSMFARAVDSGFLRRLGLVMSSRSELAEFAEITQEQYTRVPIVMPMGKIYNEEGQSMKIAVPKENIIAEVQEPLDFLFMVKNENTYMYCLEPPENLPNYKGLTFRPTVPTHAARLCFVQPADIEQTEAMTAFMDYAERFYQ